MASLRYNNDTLKDNIAGWSSSVARRAHNPKAVGSNPAPATKSPLISQEISGFSLFSELVEDVFSRGVRGDPNADPYGSESECGHTFAGFFIVLAQRRQPLKPALPLSP